MQTILSSQDGNATEVVQRILDFKKQVVSSSGGICNAKAMQIPQIRNKRIIYLLNLIRLQVLYNLHSWSF